MKQDLTIDALGKEEVVKMVYEIMREHFVFPETCEKMTDFVLNLFAEG